MRQRIILFLTLASTLLAGCVSTQSLPPTWGAPPLAAGGTCDWLNGDFTDEGQSDGNYKPSLLLTLGGKRVSHGTTRMLYVAGAMLKLGTDETGSSALTFATADFRCADGVLTLKRSVGHSRDGVLGHEQFNHVLYESNGYLVIKTTSSAMGMLLLIPVAGSDTYFYRFKRVGT